MIWKCPNCKKEVEKSDKVLSVLCGCGEFMEVLKDE